MDSSSGQASITPWGAPALLEHRAELCNNVWLAGGKVHALGHVLDRVLFRVVVELAAKDQVPVRRRREGSLGKVDPFNVPPAEGGKCAGAGGKGGMSLRRFVTAQRQQAEGATFSYRRVRSA